MVRLVEHMVEPEALSREQLYTNWLNWATNNLGGNPALAAAAANAAADVAVRGEGFDAAEKAARTTWFSTAQADATAWRPTFSDLIWTNKWVWFLILDIALLPFAVLTKGGKGAIVPVIGLPILLAIVIWQVGLDLLLSVQGAVAQASLVSVENTQNSRGGIPSYIATYQFEFQGQQYELSRTYLVEDSVRQDVIVFFYRRYPALGKVLPELLNPEST